MIVAAASAQSNSPPGGIAFVREGDVWVWRGGDVSRLLKNGSASDPRWSPSGDALLYVKLGDGYSDLLIHYFGDGSDVALTDNEPDAEIGSEEYANNSVWVIDPSWSASGVIAYASDYFTPGSTMVLWLISDLSSPPVQALQADEEDNIEGVHLSADGSIAAYTVLKRSQTGNYTTYVALRDLTDGISYVLADDRYGVYDPAIAPDNEHVAVTVRTRSGMSDLWLVSRSTGDRTRLTSDAQASAPAWLPRGGWLAYLRTVDDSFEIWAMPVNGVRAGEPIKLGRFDDLDATSGLSWTATK
jgi:Tol biopolymer transport system component